MNSIQDVLEIGPSCYERFISTERLKVIKGVDITLAGCSNLAGLYEVGRVSPLEHTLFYTISGQGTLITSKTEYSLQVNSLAILPAKQGFTVQINAPAWDVVWINLADTPRWKHLLDKPASVLENQNVAPLHHAMELLYSEPKPGLREGVYPVITHYLQQGLHIDSQNTSNNNVNSIENSQIRPDGSSSFLRIHNLFEEVEKRLQLDWNVNLMSEYAHYSPPHLHRLCQAYFQRSPIQQLIYLRIERAKSLLMHTRWPVQYIASYVGYHNVFHFSKRFKQSVGVSPSAFRAGNSLSVF
ncbi:helix-turn-helix transcriptional regulator [Glaciecola sp. 2405UD65-10]|uniref:helix-turn-helix transcriptional regulator n=1 Tax=Glaciecola sp. 2405UD65-10 TaxID=3397244 RepID=UPI003B5B7DE8